MSVIEGFRGTEGRGGHPWPEQRPGSGPEDCSCTASGASREAAASLSGRASEAVWEVMLWFPCWQQSRESERPPDSGLKRRAEATSSAAGSP